MKTKLNNDILRLVILTKNVNILLLTRKIPMCSISTTINSDLQRCYNGNKEGCMQERSKYCKDINFGAITHFKKQYLLQISEEGSLKHYYGIFML